MPPADERLCAKGVAVPDTLDVMTLVFQFMLMLVSLYGLNTRPAGALPVEPELEPLDEPLDDPLLEEPPELEPLDDPLLEEPPELEPLDDPLLEEPPELEPLLDPLGAALPELPPLDEPVASPADVAFDGPDEQPARAASANATGTAWKWRRMQRESRGRAPTAQQNARPHGRTLSARSPAQANREPERAAHGGGDAAHQPEVRYEIRESHEDDPGEHLRDAPLALAVREAHEAHGADEEREDDGVRVEVHGCPRRLPPSRAPHSVPK